MEHAAHAPDWAAAVEASGLGLYMRQSLVAYPLANLAHLLGLVLLVGPIVLFDLRILGLGRGRVTVEAASKLLTPFAVTGAVIALASGPLMFAADAKSLATSPVMIAKVSLVALALANAVAFRLAWSRRLARWDEAPAFAGRVQAAASIALWLTVAALGRMIAYL